MADRDGRSWVAADRKAVGPSVSTVESFSAASPIASGMAPDSNSDARGREASERPSVSADRSLMSFYDNARDFLGEIVDCGFSDLEELARKIQGLRGEIDQLELRACAIAGEQADRVAREERETAIPPIGA